MFTHRNRVDPKKFDYAKELRKNMTGAEDHLWSLLRKGQLDGYKFRRQSVILGYIADFYCPQVRLVVEVDGEYHLHQREYDDLRTSRMEAKGFTVMRFTNEEVLSDERFVVQEIRKMVFDLRISHLYG